MRRIVKISETGFGFIWRLPKCRCALCPASHDAPSCASPPLPRVAMGSRPKELLSAEQEEQQAVCEDVVKKEKEEEEDDDEDSDEGG